MEKFVCWTLLLISVCLATKTQATSKIAELVFMPDIHFHDVYGRFEKNKFRGISMAGGKSALIRSMSAQLRSTRLFNENYFALQQALENIAASGVKLVVLPGDFTDDGQPLHIRGLVKILDKYETEHGMRFFIANGNHDPVRPFDSPGGEPDFLDEKGREVAIYSTDHPRCHGKNIDELLICADDVGYSGYATLLTALSSKGFFPDNRDLYWASPFSAYQPDSYHYDEALKQATLENRKWSICHSTQTHLCAKIIDSSYVVEPVEGIWLLAIDANVYAPKVRQGKVIGFSGAGNQGYNGVVKYKPQLIEWIKQVTEQAREQNKLLLAFSHYPMAPFYDGQERQIQTLLGNSAFQLIRSPKAETVRALINTGLTFHVGGHMHINDTQTVNVGNKGLINIQAPSLAAYRPAYKHLSVYQGGKAKMSTMRVDNVRNFDAFFDLYRTEHQYLKRNFPNRLWNEAILTSRSFHHFADHHLRELARLRFIPEEWQSMLNKEHLLLTGWQVIKSDLDDKQERQKWLGTRGLSKENFEWTILDLVHDLYRYRNAGAIAHQDVTPLRNKAYDSVLELLSRGEDDGKELYPWLQGLISLLQGLRGGEPDDIIWIDLQKGTILSDEN